MVKITFADGSMLEGTIDELKRIGVEFTKEVDDVNWGYPQPETLSEIALRTLKEVEEAARRKQAEKELEAKWAKIGRKPNEYKKGDAVQYKKCFTKVLGMKRGKVEIKQGNNVGKTMLVDAKDLTLVFPVEARFDV